MRAVMIMFDSLNRNFLPNYGCDWTICPNFKRLAAKTITFDNSYVCSMPCMPARRDLHTSRPSFLHRGWGPMDPYDESSIRMLNEAGVYTHIVTDHQHYWEEGGSNYIQKYRSYEMVRGQQGDTFYGLVEPVPIPPEAIERNAWDAMWENSDRNNRSIMTQEKDMPQARTFEKGIDFIRRNQNSDQWFLTIETFDPHEPFFSQPEHREMYKAFYDSIRYELFDNPQYGFVHERPEQVELMRHNYASLLTMCDIYLGKVIDVFDELNLWEDTLLTVWTDHGFCLGEHDAWAKCWLPFYNEIANTPFFIWDPRSGISGERRESLVQPSIDLGPTLLEYFGIESSSLMLGHSLKGVIENDVPIRETGIYGIFGGQVNITDGQYVYMRGQIEEQMPLYEYRLMPAHMHAAMNLDDMKQAALAEPFIHTKGLKTLKIPSSRGQGAQRHPDTHRTLLYDIKDDPGMLNPISNLEVEHRMVEHLLGHFDSLDVPEEQYARLGLSMS